MRLLTIAILIFISSTAVLGQRYLFYLHGKIVEDQGARAIDTVNGYGAYQYTNIVELFRKEKFTVLSEVRKRNTDPIEYSYKVVRQIDSLIQVGVHAGDISVVGASKGAIIAMLTSSILKNKDVNFVFMAGCNNGILKQFPEIQFCGNIISIYEKSDNIGHSCLTFKESSSLAIPHYKEVELNTGLKHGFIFKPLSEWTIPTIRWAKKKYD